MLTLNDGRSELWQWDTGRTLDVDADCSQVHFSNKVFGRSLDVDVIDGVAAIPDILLQTDKELAAWAFVGTAENGYTKISKVFKVNKRNKPADYVFTQTDQTTLDDILDRIEDLEKRPSGGNGGITKEVDPTVPDWAKQPQKPTYTAAEVGALPSTTKIPSTAEDIGALPDDAFIPKNAADVGAIPTPATAQVGQTIVVKEVDEDGKPVSWECADVSGGDAWRKIVDYTTAEQVWTPDINWLDFSADLDGNPFSLKMIMVKFSGTITGGTSYRIRANQIAGGFVDFSIPAADTPFCEVVFFVSGNGVVNGIGPSGGATIKSISNVKDGDDSITLVSLRSPNYNAVHLQPGARIEIWGVDE